MASIVRVGFARIANTSGSKTFLHPKNIENIGLRCISGKTLRSEIGAPKKAPWNYKEKKYTLLNYFFDKTTSRLDENSKIIVVEGPVAAGKSKFAKELAEELDMLYLPEANQDMIYINDYGYDTRKLDEELPEACRSFDINNFLLNPKHRLAASFQIKQYSVKFSQYLDALAHVLSTGQGVVLDRCVYSDFVFAEAMYKHGYMSKGARSVYYDVRKNSIDELLRPHLVVYLDVGVPKIMDNIKKRNISYEANSQVLNPEYLATMEQHYKQKYLKDISKHSELLIYDWSEGGEVEVIVEDIERIDFNSYDKQDPKMKDWLHLMEEEWASLRHYYADKKDFIMTFMNVPRFDVPELLTDAEDAHEAKEIWEYAPGEVYVKGYDASMGDSGILFKTFIRHRDTLPVRERRTAA